MSDHLLLWRVRDLLLDGHVSLAREALLHDNEEMNYASRIKSEDTMSELGSFLVLGALRPP